MHKKLESVLILQKIYFVIKSIKYRNINVLSMLNLKKFKRIFQMYSYDFICNGLYNINIGGVYGVGYICPGNIYKSILKVNNSIMLL